MTTEYTEMRARLDNLEERLKARGVVDVKFHYEPNTSMKKLTEDLCTFLEAILEGKTSPAMPIGDSQRIGG